MACACSSSISIAIWVSPCPRPGQNPSWTAPPSGSDIFNGSGVITWDLFTGTFTRSFCPLIGESSTINFDVFPELKDSGASIILHTIVVFLLALCLLFSAGSILIALYNSVSNPYETYMGPVGIYVCSAVGASLSVLVLILYAVAISATNMAESVVLSQAGVIEVKTTNRRSTFWLGYFLVIPYTVLSLVSILIIYLYAHATYTHRREQQRPTEDAPKEIMMY
ncbi:hypothetical protein WMY93_010138 [Mugilogobius chulae]|uniref:Clarin 3 n=1 Tax=Mugilogobius chulae TaxID=88201 RepID=A0AAW0PA55_9GOBI